MSVASDPPLLRCLAQLNDDVCELILLPKLLADGSAPAAALTCSRLRQLCQRSRQKLKLTSLDNVDTATVRRWTEQLPRFPACSSVTMKICEQSCPAAPVIVDVLSRMPAMSTLTLEVTLGQQPLALAVVISGISSRLPCLRDLTLWCADSRDGAGVQLVWEQLGSITQVTSLRVDFDNPRGRAGPRDAPKGCLLPHLAPLRSLTGLQELCISSCKRLQQGGEGQQDTGFDFLGELTALTHLDIAVPSTRGFTSISSCTGLQVLRLRPVPRESSGDSRLSEADWEAIGQLGRLKKLHINQLNQPRSTTAQQPFYAALQKLTLLQAVGHCIWTYAALPVLASLPHLQHVGGMWFAVGDAAGATCEQVRCLQGGRMIDFSAFPNLEVFYPMATIGVDVWHSMSASCPKLRDIWGAPDSKTGLLDQTQFPLVGSFRSFIPPADRLSALRSLSQLTALTRLSFRSDYSLEAAALADALPHVKELHIVAFAQVECMFLAPLAKLAGQALESLYLYFTESPAREEVLALLCTLSCVPKVVVASPPAIAAFVQGAVRQARAAGLVLPADMRVVCMRPG